MLLLEWDDELAATAQAHADLCSFDHDCPSCRRLGKFSSVGQNLCLDQTNAPNPQANWTACITRWFEEASLVRNSDIHPYRFVHNTGHFTQARTPTSEPLLNRPPISTGRLQTTTTNSI
ncbi:venom allergen 5-like [Tropilaelaps mercedesae]|uniref:Venom allergen 5-like n=1 Tax=Tropilaelaps mercedesae TaxID=418985 RepID=A0A1V9XNR6_9ACAR|nr:venom allergen 5-like [Tropilaelaps mercedesae]